MSEYYKILTIEDFNYFKHYENVANKHQFEEEKNINNINIIFKTYGFLVIRKDNENYLRYHSGNNYKNIDQSLIEIYNPPSKLLNIISKIENLLNLLDNADNKN